MKTNGLEHKTFKTTTKPVNIKDDISIISNAPENAWFLAYLDHRVVIGTLINDTWKYFHQGDNDVILENIQKLRVFNRTAELFVWRTKLGKYKGRLKIDETGSEQEVVDAWQVLFGTEAEMLDKTYSKLKEKREKVVSNLQEADQFKKAGKNEAALRCYRDCLPLLAEVEASYSIVQALKKQSQEADIQQLSVQVRRGLEELSHITASTPTEAAEILADEISIKMKGQKLKLQLLPFTYQDSKMAGEFSSALHGSLKQKLLEKGVAMVEQANTEGGVKADVQIGRAHV